MRRMTAKNAARVPLLNRELGILAFNRRVLAQAADEAVPLLERLRFLTIVSSNLDEFFEIRVAGIKEQIKLGITDPGPDGLTPKETLAIVTREARTLVTQQFDLLNDALLPQLAANGHPLPAPRHLERRTARLGARLFQARGAAGADADRPRPGAPVPARLQQEPEPHRRTRGPRRLRPRLARRDRAGAQRSSRARSGCRPRSPRASTRSCTSPRCCRRTWRSSSPA